MKGTVEQFTSLLKKAGLSDVELVDDKSQSDFELDTALQAIDTSRSAIIRPTIEQEVTETVTKKIAGKVGGALERELVRTTGVDAKLFTDGMKDEEKIRIAFDHKVGLLDADKQDVSKQLDELLKKHEAKEMELTTTYEGKLTEAQKKYIDRDINEYIFSQLKDAPLPTEADRMILAKDLKSHLENQYHLGYDETKKEMGLFMKDNVQMPVLNSAGTSKVGLLDVAKEYFSPRNLWKEDMRHVNPADAMKQQQNIQTPTVVSKNHSNEPDPIGSLKDSRAAFYKQQGLPQ